MKMFHLLSKRLQTDFWGVPDTYTLKAPLTHLELNTCLWIIMHRFWPGKIDGSREDWNRPSLSNWKDRWGSETSPLPCLQHSVEQHSQVEKRHKATNQPHCVKESSNNLHNEGWSNQQPCGSAPNVLMDPKDYNYLELPNSRLELMKPLGWESLWSYYQNFYDHYTFTEISTQSAHSEKTLFCTSYWR